VKIGKHHRYPPNLAVGFSPIDTLTNIELMKNRIEEREAEIRNMRIAKSEFSYHFSQSLLKTINNLNMEVLDLKQKELIDDFKFAKKHEGPQLNEIVESYLISEF
jgi:hypothetical protein